MSNVHHTALSHLQVNVHIATEHPGKVNIHQLEFETTIENALSLSFRSGTAERRRECSKSVRVALLWYLEQLEPKWKLLDDREHHKHRKYTSQLDHLRQRWQGHLCPR